MNDRLLPCPSCARHVRVSEASCPFCATAIPAELAARPRVLLPSTRLSRAALFAVGTSAAALACSGKTTGPATFAEADAAPDESQYGPVYGAPAVDASDDVPLVDAAYGGPPQDAADDADAADAAEMGAGPLYGAPPP